MNRDAVIAILRAHEAPLRAQGVTRAALFGSMARGEATSDSDLDIMVDIDPAAPVDLYDYVGIIRYIAELFSVPVDVSDRAMLIEPVRRTAEKTRWTPSKVAPTSKEELAWLAIQDNAVLARTFVAGMTAEQFASDRRTFYAVTRCLEIISEAALAARRAAGSESPPRMATDRGFGQCVPAPLSARGVESRVWLTVHERLPALLDAAADAPTEVAGAGASTSRGCADGVVSARACDFSVNLRQGTHISCPRRRGRREIARVGRLGAAT